MKCKMENLHNTPNPDRVRPKQAADHDGAEMTAASKISEPGIPTPSPTWACELTQLRADAPLRPCDWRTRLAKAIEHHRDRRVVEKLCSWADEPVQTLLQFESNAPDHPLAQARSLLAPTRKQLRVEVEARLLAGQPSIAITEATGVTTDAIDLYHDTHFHCRDRLHATGYVVHVILGTVPPTKPGTGPPFELLRWFGFFYGPAVIDAVLHALRDWDADCKPVRGSSAAELSRHARYLTARAAIMARMLPIQGLGRADLRTLMTMGEAATRTKKPTPSMGCLAASTAKQGAQSCVSGSGERLDTANSAMGSPLHNADPVYGCGISAGGR